jgi:atypical dual specificity phosphatase
VTRVPPDGGPASIICEACFLRLREADASALLAALPSLAAGADTDCFSCGCAAGGSTRVIRNIDTGLPFCMPCLKQSRAATLAFERDRKVPLDVVPDEVVPGVLFIGPQEAQANRATLAARGITRVLICCEYLPAYHEPGTSGLRYHRLPLQDSLAQHLAAYLPSALAFIAQGAASGERTLVHCAAGVSRSGSVAVEFVRRVAALPLDTALAAARAARSAINPNTNFVRQLRELPEGGAVAVAAAAATSAGGVGVGAGATPAVATTTTLALLGDSTLDNITWVYGEGEKCVAQHLRDASCFRGVLNFAADGFTTGDVLHGGDAVLSASARARVGEPFPPPPPGAPSRHFFRPLAALSDAAAALPPGSALAVALSVGGNDVRVCLQAPAEIPAALARLQENYPRILERALAHTPNVVVVMCYQPSLADATYNLYEVLEGLPLPGCGGFSGQQKLQRLLELVYAPILALARKHRLAVVDLPRSMDPTDGSLFRQQIEPSDAGGARIAALLAHAALRHDPARDGSALYALPGRGGEVVAVPNAEGFVYRVADPVRR